MSKSPIWQFSVHTTSPEVLQALEWLQDGEKALIPSTNIPFKIQEIAASVIGSWELQKLQMEEKLVKKMKLHLFAGANRLRGHSLNLGLLT